MSLLAQKVSDPVNKSSHNTLLVVQYPIRPFDDTNLKFIKPFEVTTECDGLLIKRSNKTDMKSYEDKKTLFWAKVVSGNLL